MRTNDLLLINIFFTLLLGVCAVAYAMRTEERAEEKYRELKKELAEIRERKGIIF